VTVTTDKHEPHVFMDVNELPMTPPLGNSGLSGGYKMPPIPGRVSGLCGICHEPRTDRLHIDGEAQADEESPHWG
jgi:hypothetical protein